MIQFIECLLVQNLVIFIHTKRVAIVCSLFCGFSNDLHLYSRISVTSVRQNVKWARKVCRRLVNIMRGEGADTKVLEMFCRSVVQAVLLFG